jgi:L-malate glycosyltransferase
MRVAILAPNYYRLESGNAVTVRRIERHLRLLGCEVRVFPVDQLSGEQLVAGVREFAPSLLHAFQGYLGGRVALEVSQTLALPYLVTLTGTDVYKALSDQRSHDTHQALRGAARLVAFHPTVKRHLAEHLPTLEERTVVIPQGVVIPPEPATAGKEESGEAFTFLLPAGLRPIKNVVFPLCPLAELHESHPELKFLLLGPVLDPAYAAEVMDALEPLPFALYLGTVPHEEMAELYREADVVLNTSFAEGGMANSVLEAMANGKPVLASDIDGNRSIVKEGVTGLLYRDEAEFRSKANLLMMDHQLRERLGRNARALVREKHSPEKEAEAYLALYQEILSA